ncbi:hypothetical protein RUM44_005184 [Polyplax serrata]|uniref:Uncharacterized protein n=1 Tax=Polyplax serrata TaxID=468196 RepID=A0ABR1AEA3_POLSC
MSDSTRTPSKLDIQRIDALVRRLGRKKEAVGVVPGPGPGPPEGHKANNLNGKTGMETKGKKQRAEEEKKIRKTAEKRQKMSVEMADEKPKSGHHVMNRGPTEKKTVVDDFGEGLHRPFISTARKKL